MDNGKLHIIFCDKPAFAACNTPGYLDAPQAWGCQQRPTLGKTTPRAPGTRTPRVQTAKLEAATLSTSAAAAEGILMGDTHEG